VALGDVYFLTEYISTGLCHDLGEQFPPVARLALGGVIMTAIYGWVLLSLMGRRELYVGIFTTLVRERG
jgi:hypothetical protein